MSAEDSERCKCTLRESLLGDGCKMCKPYLHIEKLESSLENAEGEITNLEIRITQLESDLAESQKVIKVVDSLVAAKGRYHTAQWYQKMVTVLDEYKAAIKEQQ